MLIMWMFTSMMRKKNLQIELYGLSSCVFAKQGSIEEWPNIKVKAHLLSQHLWALRTMLQLPNGPCTGHWELDFSLKKYLL